MANLDRPNAQIGLGFQPFVGTCTDGHAPAWCGYSLNDVTILLQNLKNHGYTTFRTFGSGPWSGANQRSNCWNMEAAANIGGIRMWNCAALDPGSDDISHKQIDAAVEQAAKYKDGNDYVALGIVVGVEPIGLQGIAMSKVVEFINYAKSKRDAAGLTAAQMPVTTSEQMGVLTGPEHKDVITAVEGVILANTYPVLACNITIETAITDPDWGLNKRYDLLRDQINSYGLTDLTIHVGETGWPTAGTIDPPATGCSVAKTGVENQEKYLAAVGDWVKTKDPNMTVFMFEAYNELWKGNCDTSNKDANWGMFADPDGLHITPLYGACQTPANP